jgi:hypothetical protein
LDFSRQIEDNRRALIADVLRRLEEQLWPFHYALDAFLAQLFKAVIPQDWREKLHAFIAEQEGEGFTIAESSVSELEAWIEAWAKDCKLWPEEAGAEQATEDQNDEGSESTFVLSVIPSISGPHASNKSTGASQVTTTKAHLPADARGRWIEGVKGDGVFEYNDSPVNQKDGLVGKRVRFKDNFISIGGFPAEAYYLNDASAASVEIDEVTGGKLDNAAADAKMREIRGDPNWKRPVGYRWNHAGSPGAKIMELVDAKLHTAIAHSGNAAAVRAARAFSVLDVYLTIRDGLEYLGAIYPEYEVGARMVYQFQADDGSIFIIWPKGWFYSAKVEFIEGPRSGEKLDITVEDVDRYRKIAEREWGEYIPGNRLRGPRFLPGRKRSTIPYMMTDEYGLEYEAGWIDAEGLHMHPLPKRPLL